MSIPKYIEFDSTYRNRILYPFPSQFTISMTNQKNSAENALDPVVLSNPIFAWSSNAFGITAVGNVTTAPTVNVAIAGTVQAPNPASSIISNTTDNSIIVLNSASTTYFQQLNNYYVGANIIITNANGTNTRRIIKYSYLGNVGGLDRCVITVNSPFQDSLNLESIASNFTITDPTDFVDTDYPLIFIPNGLSQANSYIDYYIYNQTTNKSLTILYYDEITHVALLEPNTYTTTWLTTHSFCLRKELPANIGLTTTTAVTNNVNSVTITGGSTTDGVYNNMWLRVLPIGSITPSPPISGIYFYQDNYPISYPNVYGNITPISTANAYSEITKIQSYIGLTGVATLNPPLYYTPTNNSLEILTFSYDNVYPFSYTGKDRDASNCKIELVNLILPNITLASGYGGRIANYPYVYVKLSNVSAPFGGTNKLIISNNPNATSMVFRCPINDVNHPQNSPFIKLDGNGMSQIFAFTAYDDLSFEVLLPNGDHYKTLQQDYYSPSEPNYQVQITAVFRFEKL